MPRRNPQISKGKVRCLRHVSPVPPAQHRGLTPRGILQTNGSRDNHEGIPETQQKPNEWNNQNARPGSSSPDQIEIPYDCTIPATQEKVRESQIAWKGPMAGQQSDGASNSRAMKGGPVPSAPDNPRLPGLQTKPRKD